MRAKFAVGGHTVSTASNFGSMQAMALGAGVSQQSGSRDASVSTVSTISNKINASCYVSAVFDPGLAVLLP